MGTVAAITGRSLEELEADGATAPEPKQNLNRSTSAATRGFRSSPDFTGRLVTDPTGANLRDPETGKSLGGRKVGSKNSVTNEARSFALEIVRSPEYRASLLQRVKSGTLAANIEAMLWAYAYGKPAERLEITNPGPTAALAELSLAELAERADLISRVLKEVGDVEAAELAVNLVDQAAEARRNAPIDVTPVRVDEAAK